MNDRRRPRTPARPKPAPVLTGPVQLDDDTRNALILFNARVEAQAAKERDARRVEKTAKAKDDAAAAVRALESDPKASAEARAEANAAYLAAVDAWNRAKSGEPEPAATADAASADDDDTTDEAAADDTAEPAAEADASAPDAAADAPAAED